MGNGPKSGIYLKFYVPENRRHHGVLVYEWLLERAHQLGLRGGSAFRAIAGFGRHGILHEEHFFELAGDTPVEVMFVVDAEEEVRLLEALQAERLSLFYVRMPVEYGILKSPPKGEA